MALVVWESRDSWDTPQPVWSGISPFTASGLKLFSDIFYTYIIGTYNSWIGNNLLRLDTQEREEVTILPYEGEEIGPTSDISKFVMCHYINDIGLAQYSVMIEQNYDTGVDKLFSTIYPEFQDGWQEFPQIFGVPIDIVFPDIPESPRFVVGITEQPLEHVIVILTTPGLGTRLNSNWSAMISGAIVTDLEAIRFI